MIAQHQHCVYYKTGVHYNCSVCTKGTGEGMSKSFGVWHSRVASFKTEVFNELLVLGHPLMRVCNLQGLAHFAVSFFDQ
jgi:hypothetical protein